MEGSSHDYDETFEVSDSPESATATPDNEGMNVCRVAAISIMLGGDGDGIRDLADELAALGFPPSLVFGDFGWEGGDLLELLDSLEEQQDVYESRVVAWRTLQETGRMDAALAFVVAVLGSGLERESAVAAAVLSRLIGPVTGLVFPRFWAWPPDWPNVYDLGIPDWPELLWWGGPGGEPFVSDNEEELRYEVPWRPDAWSLLYRSAMAGSGSARRTAAVLELLVRVRLGLALRSADPITRSLARSALLASAAATVPPSGSTTAPVAGAVVSTMIHGTWGWKGDWWRPRPGSFHDFILNTHRRNLYKEGARFSWSGAYSASERALAAADFCDWANDRARPGLQTVLAHSYGGEIAARSRIAGAAIDQIILLSSPANAYVRTAANDPAVHTVDVRLRFDPVLASARVRQRIRPLPPNVTEVILAKWRLDHGATHKQSVWLAENVASRGGI